MDKQEMNTLLQVAIACTTFANDHQGMTPSSTSDLTPYLGKSFNLSQVDLVPIGNLFEIKNLSSVVLVKSKRVSASGRRAVAFADGHCELLPDQALRPRP